MIGCEKVKQFYDVREEGLNLMSSPVNVRIRRVFNHRNSENGVPASSVLLPEGQSSQLIDLCEGNNARQNLQLMAELSNIFDNGSHKGQEFMKQLQLRGVPRSCTSQLAWRWFISQTRHQDDGKIGPIAFSSLDESLMVSEATASETYSIPMADASKRKIGLAYSNKLYSYTTRNFYRLMMLNRPEVRPLFAIQLKVNEDILDVEVLESDDRETLTDRVCRDNLISTEYRKLLQGKIIDALLKILQRQQINPALREKVERFISRNTQLPQRHIYSIPTEPNVQVSSELSAASPIKTKSPQKRSTPVQCKENLVDRSDNSIHSPEKKKEFTSPSPKQYRQANRHLYCHRIGGNAEVEVPRSSPKGAGMLQTHSANTAVDSKPQIQLKVQQKAKPSGIKKQNTTMAYKTTVVTKQKQAVNSSVATIAKVPDPKPEKPAHKKTFTEADEDLIKAYKVVVAKCKDPEMKGMAKRFLETLNQSFVEASPQQVRRKTPPAPKQQNPPSEKKKSPEKVEVEESLPNKVSALSLQSRERLKRLEALQQPAVPGNSYQDQLKNYVVDKHDRQPGKNSPTRPHQQSQQQSNFHLSTGNPVIDQPYERRYSREAVARSPYDHLNSKYQSNNNTVQRGSTGNINRSLECSPFVAHSNRYHYQTSLQPAQTSQLPRQSSQPYHLDNKYRSTSAIRRYRYLQDQ